MFIRSSEPEVLGLVFKAGSTLMVMRRDKWTIRARLRCRILPRDLAPAWYEGIQAPIHFTNT